MRGAVDRGPHAPMLGLGTVEKVIETHNPSPSAAVNPRSSVPISFQSFFSNPFSPVPPLSVVICKWCVMPMMKTDLALTLVRCNCGMRLCHSECAMKANREPFVYCVCMGGHKVVDLTDPFREVLKGR